MPLACHLLLCDIAQRCRSQTTKPAQRMVNWIGQSSSCALPVWIGTAAIFTMFMVLLFALHRWKRWVQHRRHRRRRICGGSAATRLKGVRHRRGYRHTSNLSGSGCTRWVIAVVLVLLAAFSMGSPFRCRGSDVGLGGAYYSVDAQRELVGLGTALQRGAFGTRAPSVICSGNQLVGGGDAVTGISLAWRLWWR